MELSAQILLLLLCAMIFVTFFSGATKTSDSLTLASQRVSEENKNGLHAVRALISFEKGFVYSCNAGEVLVFKKVESLKLI